jgi:amidase
MDTDRSHEARMTNPGPYASATDDLAALHEKKTSSVALVEQAIERIEKIDAKINAVVVRDFDRARAAAKNADALRAKGEWRPLLGLPVTVKEAFDVAGLPTTWSFPGFKDYVAPVDCAIVARLKTAGAVVVGKTNVPMFLGDWQADSPIYGRTNNPYDLARTSGGSTGGAAGVAAGMVTLEFGSDLAGSIRVPASFCGVFGHKPSFGIVPMRGMCPPHTPDGTGIPLSVLGPLARTADDLELAFDAVAGPDGMEATGYRLTLPKARHETLRGCRVLVLDAHPVVAVDGEIAGGLHALAGGLEKAGAKVLRKCDALPDLMETLDCFGKILNTVTSRGAPPQGNVPSAFEWMDMLDRQYVIRRKWAALFDHVDVVLAPAFGTTAFPHLPTQGARTLKINGRDEPYGDQGAWSSMAGVANLPSTVAPIGMTKTGLPIGAQIIGPYLEDRTTIHFARLLEREFGGFVAPKIPPPLAGGG